MTRSLVSPSVALLGTTLAFASGCGGDDVRYGYFRIDVKVEDAATLDNLLMVARCVVSVEGPRTDFAYMKGCEHKTVRRRELGYFDYSASQPSGTYRFTVTLEDPAHKALARGVSEDLSVRLDDTVSSSVLVKLLPVPNP